MTSEYSSTGWPAIDALPAALAYSTLFDWCADCLVRHSLAGPRFDALAAQVVFEPESLRLVRRFETPLLLAAQWRVEQLLAAGFHTALRLDTRRNYWRIASNIAPWQSDCLRRRGFARASFLTWLATVCPQAAPDALLACFGGEVRI